MADELVDVFDENYEIQGQCMKSVAHKFGLWVHSFHCWIVCTKGPGSVFVQLRSPTKKLFPNYLDISAAGHLKSGETVEDGVREIQEEIGLAVDFRALIPLGIKHDTAKLAGITNRQFCHVFLLPTEIALDSLQPDGDEVYGLVEISIQDGLDLFSGAKASVQANGVEFDAKTREWRDVSKPVSQDLFIPRIDNYYYKVFIMADLHMRGSAHLSI